MTIGMLDWGIGGLSVLQQLRKQRPDVTCVYLSDSKSTPYGQMTKKELNQRLNQITNFFRQKKITQIIIACNAASTALDQVIESNPDVTFYGMLDTGVQLIRSARVKKCLILGGRRTIRSNYFQNAFKDLDVAIQAKPAQPWSAFIEKGDMSSHLFIRSLNRVLSNLRFAPDSILLACTHYPAIRSQIEAYFTHVKILDPSEFVIKKFSAQNKKSKATGKYTYFTTGNGASMKKSSLKAFQFRIDHIKKIKI